MPNWCNNTFELVGPKEEIKKFESFLEERNGKDWFDFFAPCPDELKNVGDVSFHTSEKQTQPLIEKYGYSDWYSFGIGEWGCKWNCDANDWTVNEYDEENLSINFWFDSPWGPPENLYQNISDGKFGEDLHVFAEWHEEGMAFIGRFDDGFSETFEYSDLDSLDGIPEDLIENWNLREMLEERADEYEDDESDEEIVEEDEETDSEDKDLEQSLEELRKEFEQALANDDENVKGKKKWPL